MAAKPTKAPPRVANKPRLAEQIIELKMNVKTVEEDVEQLRRDLASASQRLEDASASHGW
jgi:hypothetical protein